MRGAGGHVAPRPAPPATATAEVKYRHWATAGPAFPGLSPAQEVPHGHRTCSPTCRISPAITSGLKAAAPLLAATMDYLAREVPSWYDQVRLIDATPVPCGASRETVKRSKLAGWAGYGYCAAHSRWYWA